MMVSGLRPILPVVPQDGVISPLLLIAYIYDLSVGVENKIVRYANDTSIAGTVVFTNGKSSY